MITSNGKKFAQSNKEFINSLFDKDGTCVGYARKYKHSVVLMDMQKNKVGVINRHGVLGCATKQVDGKYWYSYADVDLVGRYESYTQQVNECRLALDSNN